jgi:hypothetical protein
MHLLLIFGNESSKKLTQLVGTYYFSVQNSFLTSIGDISPHSFIVFGGIYYNFIKNQPNMTLSTFFKFDFSPIFTLCCIRNQCQVIYLPFAPWISFIT